MKAVEIMVEGTSKHDSSNKDQKPHGKIDLSAEKGSDSSNSGEKDQIDDSKTESQKMFWEDGIESRIQCSYCSSDFEKKIQLDAHVKDKHELKSFDCGFCGSCFSEKSDLHAHVKEEHTSKILA